MNQQFVDKSTHILRDRHVQDLFAFLKDKSPGDLVTYEEMESHIGNPVRHAHFYILSGARKKCLEETGLVFGTVRGIGIQCLDPNEAVDSVDNYKTQLRKIAKKGAKTLASVSYENLDDNHKRKYNQDMSIFGATRMIMSSAVQHKLEKHFEKGLMDYSDTLSLLGLVK